MGAACALQCNGYSLAERRNRKAKGEGEAGENEEAENTAFTVDNDGSSDEESPSSRNSTAHYTPNYR